MDTAQNNKTYQRRRRIFGTLSLFIVVVLFIGLAFFLYRMFLKRIKTPEEFRTYIESYGWKGRFVFLGLQILQVTVALIPGEILEVGAGYAFGPVEGTLLCMAGVAVASAFIFLLTKKWGIKLVEIFISREKINKLRFINSEKKLKRTVFILFFIPGTPKDLFTYFIGLTRIRLHEFLVISMIARIPSVVSSTIGGHIIGAQYYFSAAILFGVTGLVSLGGMALYSWVVHRRNMNADKTENGKAEKR
ncbi:MAG: VTT domain-containing protein [Oscillospiraceae bacterium]|nr:VTT domain-containing protein [Oscillospiraceae bacterium]MDD4413188.1 VTT domain-containing protein [Oscillospiraceae bacterium]